MRHWKRTIQVRASFECGANAEKGEERMVSIATSARDWLITLVLARQMMPGRAGRTGEVVDWAQERTKM